MVVTIAVLRHLDRHPKEASGLPKVNAVLHRPSGGGVPRRMGRDMLVEARRLNGCGEALSDGATGLPFHSTTARVEIPS